MANIDKDILIQKFLNGNASEKEIALVEQLKADDPAFAELLKQETLVWEFSHLGGLVELKAKMKQMDLKPAKKSYKKWMIAAGGVALLGTALLLSESEEATKKKPEELLTEKHRDVEAQKTPKTEYSSEAVEIERAQKGDDHIADQEKGASEIQTRSKNNIANSNAKVTQSDQSKAYQVPSNTKVDSVDNTQSSIHPCEVSFIEPEFTLNPTCENKEDGEILITNVDGAFPPFSYILRGVRNESSPNRLFSNLSAKTYELIVVDAEKCQKQFTLTVESKECRDQEMIISSLNPDVPCVFDLTENDGVLYIYNSEGAMIYQLNFTSEKHLEWFGKDKNGSPLPTGVYFYQIKYASGKRDNGTITIAN